MYLLRTASRLKGLLLMKHRKYLRYTFKSVWNAIKVMINDAQMQIKIYNQSSFSFFHDCDRIITLGPRKG